MGMAATWLILGILNLATSATEGAYPEKFSSPSSYGSRIRPVWTAWSQWSHCSATCGRGIRTRYRDCVGQDGMRLVRLDTMSCDGDRKEYFVCMARDCPKSFPDSRTHQCSQKNGDLVLEQLYEWVPFYGGSNPCELTCLARGYSFLYNFGHVEDGTPCMREGKDMCIQGACLSIGCDGRVGSLAVEDKCHVCGGRNANCAHNENSYRVRHPDSGNFGYREIAKIPTGSSYLEVKDFSKNYLALADARQTYIINGNWLIDWPGRYDVAGTVIQYERTWDNYETLTAEGPTKEDLFVMLVFRAENPGIQYQFWIPSDKLGEVHEAEKRREEEAKALQNIHNSYIFDPDGFESKEKEDKPQEKGKDVGDNTIDEDVDYYDIRGGGLGSVPNQIPQQDEDKGNLNAASGLKVESVPSTDHLFVTPETKKSTTGGTTTDEDLPRSRSRKNRRRKGKKSKNPKVSKIPDENMRNSTNNIPDYCGKCTRAKNRIKHYCHSDFVVRASILHYGITDNYTRYEVRVVDSYKKKYNLLQREYFWTPGRCRCPRLHPGKEYIIMGNLVANMKTRQSKLTVTKTDYIRGYNKGNHMKIRNIQNKPLICDNIKL